MRYRTFGRTGWQVGEVGYGMWGMGGWTGSDDAESLVSLSLAVDNGVNFFDTAWAYGEGHSERLLGNVLTGNRNKRLYAATKVPPKNRKWPSRRGYRLDDVFPPEYIREYADRSRENLGVGTIDLLQLHVWEDDWADDAGLRAAVEGLKGDGVISAFGISINRWEPWNGVRAVQNGLVDSVQVIYNIFDQAPEDELFPACREHGVGVIARVPFDEGSLTGMLTRESRWPEGDWRNTYFVPENLVASVQHADALKPLVPEGSTMPEMAIRFILSNPDVSTLIPGMRRKTHVESNVGAAELGPLPDDLLAELRKHRWDREPTEWSQ